MKSGSDWRAGVVNGLTSRNDDLSQPTRVRDSAPAPSLGCRVRRIPEIPADSHRPSAEPGREVK